MSLIHTTTVFRSSTRMAAFSPRGALPARGTDSLTTQLASPLTLVELGITSGIGGGLFDPEGTVTREQMAAFLTRALAEVPADGYCGTEGPFTDVPYGLWSCKYVKRLVELGITAGIGEGLYGPGNPVTRAQMAVFLARAFLGM